MNQSTRSTDVPMSTALLGIRIFVTGAFGALALFHFSSFSPTFGSGHPVLKWVYASLPCTHLWLQIPGVCAWSLSSFWLFATPWAEAQQAPLSMEFSRQEYWNGCHFLLQGIFPTQGSNLRLLYKQADSLPLSHLGSPMIPGTHSYLITPFHLAYRKRQKQKP